MIKYNIHEKVLRAVPGETVTNTGDKQLIIDGISKAVI